MAGNDDLMLLMVRFVGVSGLLLLVFDEFLLLVAFNAEFLLSVLLIVTVYSRANFFCGIVCCIAASVELFVLLLLWYWWRLIQGCYY